jgi:hypothetical protein
MRRFRAPTFFSRWRRCAVANSCEYPYGCACRCCRVGEVPVDCRVAGE